MSKYGLAYIPEAHCDLRYGGERIDVTRVPTGAEPIEELLYEEPIAVGQIGVYKNDLRKRFLSDWIIRTEVVRGRSLEEVWRASVRSASPPWARESTSNPTIECRHVAVTHRD